jgi:sialidase-1
MTVATRPGDDAQASQPGHVLALFRLAEPGFLIACWSEDAGASWSLPVQTAVWGYPPHLLRLRDGRLLCSVGVRREPLGVQAFISEDGTSWDTAHPALLRGDGETRDLGYPVSVQLDDGCIFTVYYTTIGGVTHVAASRWELPW